MVRYKIIKGLKMKYIAQYTQIDENDNINLNNIEIAVGLGLVDNLKPSQYFYKALDESQTYKELDCKIKNYYDGKSLSQSEKAQKECDIVSINIAKYLEKNGFKFSPMMLKLIHKNIFTGAFEQTLEKYIGVFRDVNITKDEDILGGRSVIYADYDEINELLEYDFELEREKDYANMNRESQAMSVAKFISGIWQIHPFREGNTRTIAVFAIKYLQNKGFDINNNVFKEYSKYFRDALVKANYENMREGIKSDFTYLESFFNKFILNKETRLKPFDS